MTSSASPSSLAAPGGGVQATERTSGMRRNVPAVCDALRPWGPRGLAPDLLGAFALQPVQNINVFETIPAPLRACCCRYPFPPARNLEFLPMASIKTAIPFLAAALFAAGMASAAPLKLSTSFDVGLSDAATDTSDPNGLAGSTITIDAIFADDLTFQRNVVTSTSSSITIANSSVAANNQRFVLDPLSLLARGGAQLGNLGGNIFLTAINPFQIPGLGHFDQTRRRWSLRFDQQQHSAYAETSGIRRLLRNPTVPVRHAVLRPRPAGIHRDQRQHDGVDSRRHRPGAAAGRAATAPRRDARPWWSRRGLPSSSRRSLTRCGRGRGSAPGSLTIMRARQSASISGSPRRDHFRYISRPTGDPAAICARATAQTAAASDGSAPCCSIQTRACAFTRAFSALSSA